MHPAVGVFITPVQGPFGLAATWRNVPKKDSSRTCPCAPSVGDARQFLAVAFFVATVASNGLRQAAAQMVLSAAVYLLVNSAHSDLL